MGVTGTAGRTRLSVGDRIAVGLVKLEAGVWLMRSRFFFGSFLVAAGWFAASAPPATWRLVFALTYASLMVGVIWIMNDVLDHEKDEATAPHNPIPSGLLSVRGASAAGAVVFAGAVAAALVAARGSVSLAAIALGCSALGIGGFALYTVFKHLGVVASLFAAVGSLSVPLGGWLVAGRGRAGMFALVLLYTFLEAMGSNTQAGLFDMDDDGKVGNRTLAVRVGGTGAAWFAFACDALLVPVCVAVGVAADAPWYAYVLLAGAGAALTVTFHGVLPTFAEPGRGRVQRYADFRHYSNARFLVKTALIGMFAMGFALATAAAMQLLWRLLEVGYRRRVIEGGLRRRLDRIVGGAGSARDASPAVPA